jgi:hypothetical protein
MCAAVLPRVYAQAVDPTEDARIEIVVHAHRIKNFGAILHEARQNFVDIGYWERILRVKTIHRAVGARARALPGFPQLIVFAHEQQVFGLRPPRYQYGDRIGLRKSGQVVKMAVLPIGIFNVGVTVADRCRGQDRDSVLADHAHELTAAARKLSSIHGSAQCSRCAEGYTWLRSGRSSSNTTCAATRMNSTSSA